MLALPTPSDKDGHGPENGSAEGRTRGMILLAEPIPGDKDWLIEHRIFSIVEHNVFIIIFVNIAPGDELILVAQRTSSQMKVAAQFLVGVYITGKFKQRR